MLTFIKIYAALALLFPACWAVVGWRLNKRREAEIEPIQPIIKADRTIWS